MSAKIERESEDTTAQYATLDEAREAIIALQEGDYVKLMIIAKCWAKRFSGNIVQADDLLHDAFMKTLDGTRKWNKRVGIVRHLDGVMRSDSSHIAKERVDRPRFALSDLTADDAVEPDEKRRLRARDETERVLSLFAGDEKATRAFQLRLEGYTGPEIRRKLRWSETEYDTVAKRIHRRLGKHLTEEGHEL